MTPEEKLRAMLSDFNRAENDGAAVGDHLSDEDLMKLIENKTFSDAGVLSVTNGQKVTAAAPHSAQHRHLAGCDSCLDRFSDFYAFFAPAGEKEAVASKKEIADAWASFALRISKETEKTGFWARHFPAIKKPEIFGVFGWGLAALLLLIAGLTSFTAWQAKNENSELAGRLERQKQESEERLKSIELSAQNQNIAEQEKTRLAAEKDDLQKQIATLQNEIDRTERQKMGRHQISAPANNGNLPATKPDNSLVAVNTPIFDVFPADAVVRSGGTDQNKLIVPNAAKSVVLILNTTGRGDFPISSAVLISGTGKTVWRGSGLRKDAAGNFTLTLTRAALQNGNYRLKLSGKDSSGALASVEYSIIIQIGK